MGSKLKSSLLFLGLLIASIAIAYGILIVGGGGSAEGGANFLDAYKAPLTIFRLSACAALVVFWPNIVNYFASKSEWPEDRTLAMLQLRWKILFWIVILELIVVQGLLAKLVGLFFE